MWSFFRKQASKAGADAWADTDPQNLARRRPLSFEALVSDMGDFTDLASHDTALKFWIPEPVEQALQELCERDGDSMSDALRRFFIIHCYGLYAYHVFSDAMPGFHKYKESLPRFSRPPDPPGKKRVATYWVVELGKNIAPIKIWVPKRLKGDLGKLAGHVGLTLSNYVREIVISRALGHGMLPQRPEMMSYPSPVAEAWLEDREVAWRQVSWDEYGEYRMGECRDEWVDDPDYCEEKK